VFREDYSVVKGEKKSTEQKAPKVKHFLMQACAHSHPKVGCGCALGFVGIVCIFTDLSTYVYLYTPM